MDCFVPIPKNVPSDKISPCFCCDPEAPPYATQSDSYGTPKSSDPTTLSHVPNPQHPLLHYPSNGYHAQLMASHGACGKMTPRVRLRKRTLSYGSSEVVFDSSNVTYVSEIVKVTVTQNLSKEEEAEKGEQKEDANGAFEEQRHEAPADENDDPQLLKRRLEARLSLSRTSMLTCYVIVTLSLFSLVLPPVGGEALPEKVRRVDRDVDDDYDRGDQQVFQVARVVGASVALPCAIASSGNTVEGEEDGKLKWIKRNPRETITEGEHIVVDNWEHRFELGRNNYTLYIKNLEIYDGARYQCTTVGRPMVDGKDKGRRRSATVLLTVFEVPRCDAWDPLGTGDWAAGDIAFGGECSTVTRGGVKPSLEWSRGSTGQHGLGTPDIYPGDPPQILSSLYFKPTHEDQGTNLTCQLLHPHLDPEDVGKYTCFIGPLEILFDVIFFCESEQYVDPSDPEFNVTCDVWANPPVDPNHLYWIPQNLDKPPLSDLINTSDCWQVRQKTFQTSSYMAAPHVTRTSVTVDKHLDKFIDSLDFVLQARLNNKKNITMLIYDHDGERRKIRGFDEDLFISMLMICIGGVIVLSTLLVVFIFGAYDWYQSFRPRDFATGYEKLRKVDASKRSLEKRGSASGALAAAAAAADAPTAPTAGSAAAAKPQLTKRFPTVAS